ncbi:hypothetical protein CK203_039365 [Vitis vinifera]|uniref:Integrase catalytic domain-containing protein n=1 Tax=Vitis vinifera TaxID=29760 RepID=A0A438I742_VITVI|nr:hypothetical protein CK203_039365 [Vitis vinifera]
MTSITGWRLYFDGATNQSGFGIGILLISPQGDHIPRSVRLAFSDHHRLTNNIVEYEACITGLETALDLALDSWRSTGIPTWPLLIETRSAPAYYCLIGEIEDQIEFHDCCQFVQRCQECQMHGDLIHVPPSELHALTSPWPFSVWGVDIIGKISPKFPVGKVDTLIQEYGIQHHRSSAYRSQTNGAVEAVNKNIKRILRKMVETLGIATLEASLDRVGAGPYVIRDLTREGAAWLTDLDGKSVHRASWGPTLVRFVFIDWIYEHCGHGVILRLFFLHHCLFLFVSILHLHIVYLLVQFLSSLFTSLLFSLCDDDALSSQSYQSGLSHLAHMVLRYLTLRTQGFGIIYWEIWAFVSHRFIHLLPLAYITVRVVSITSGDIEGHILSFHSVYLPQVHDQR